MERRRSKEAARLHRDAIAFLAIRRHASGRRVAGRCLSLEQPAEGDSIERRTDPHADDARSLL
jgi:hypothetical protein